MDSARWWCLLVLLCGPKDILRGGISRRWFTCDLQLLITSQNHPSLARSPLVMQWLHTSAGGIFQKITTDLAWVYKVGGGGGGSV